MTKNQIVYSNAYYDIEVSNNIPRIYDKVGGVVIVPVTTDGKMILIEAERPLIGRRSWEFPRGFREVSEDSKTAGARELAEETGLKAQTYTHIGTVCPNNGLLSSEIDIILAEGIILKDVKLQSEEGIRDKKCVSKKELEKLVQTEITDGFTLAALTRYLLR